MALDVWVPSVPVLTTEQKVSQTYNADMASNIFRALIGQLEETPIEDLIDDRLLYPQSY